MLFFYDLYCACFFEGNTKMLANKKYLISKNQVQNLIQRIKTIEQFWNRRVLIVLIHRIKELSTNK